MGSSPNTEFIELELELSDQYLHTVCDPFDFSNPIINPVQLSNEMTQMCHQLNGVGLAANQVGLNTRVVAIKGIDSCMFNPKIVSNSVEQSVMEEGCLSFPGLIVKVKRYKSVRVRYQDASGQVKTDTFAGLTARVIQHEIDHINGILFFNQANLYHREQAMRRWKHVKRTNHI